MSVWELTMLHAKGRLRLPMPLSTWTEQALALPEITLLPLAEPAVMLDSCTPPGIFHVDPADRLLMSTARAQGATLLTGDEKILACGLEGHVRVMGV